MSVTAEMKPGHATAPSAGNPILPELRGALHLHSEEEECQQGKDRHCRGAASQWLCSSPHPISMARGQIAGQALNPLLSAGCSHSHLATKPVPMAPSGSHIFPLQPCLLLQPKSKCSKPMFPSSRELFPQGNCGLKTSL